MDDLAKSAEAILEGESEAMLDELLALVGSSAGARPKVLVQLSDNKKSIIHGRQALKKGYSHYMVKFSNSHDDKESGAVEYVYSLMAKEAGLQMPQTTLIDGKHGRYFAIERFDRVGDERVHMHSVAGLVHADFRFPSLDYDDLMKLTLHLTKSYEEVGKMFRLACFNLFAHNRDDHAKNFSFLMDSKGVWRLSPAYDLTFSYGVGAEHSTMYMGEGKKPTSAHLERVAKKYQIKEYKVIIEQVRHGVNRWESLAREINISQRVKQNITKIIRENI